MRSLIRAWRGALVAGVLMAMATGGSASAVSTSQTYWIAASGQIVIQGHGYGHGHGMSQYGAEGAAQQGLTHQQILDFYYPGTTLQQAKGMIRVLISAAPTGRLVVRPADGLTVTDLGTGSSYQLPVVDSVKKWRLKPSRGGADRVAYLTDKWHFVRVNGSRTLSGIGQFSASGPLTILTPSGARTYRGALRLAVDDSGVRRVVNVVSLDQYTMGVVSSEMPPSWDAEAVESQAIAARTYGAWSRAQYRNRYYQICDTTMCQVYGGVGSEDSRGNDAVTATSRQILTYNGKPAFTQFSSSNGGWMAEGSQPYLVSKQDPYDGWSGNPVHDWTVTVDASTLESAYPSIGTLQKVLVTQRDGGGQWQGRVESMTLVGTNGSVDIYGETFRYLLGLKSSWFTLAPTPIIQRWQKIGGSGSVVGGVASAEVNTHGGVTQKFDHGRIYYSPTTPAREVYGQVLYRYGKFGGAGSALGFPTAAVTAVGKGHYGSFEGGDIYGRPRKGSFVLLGDLAARYVEHGGPTSDLGWPTSGMQATDYGFRATFEHGYIDYFADTQSTRVVVNS